MTSAGRSMTSRTVSLFFDELHFSLQPCGMSELTGDRRTRRREAAYLQRRRYPRLALDVDWFVESEGCSTLGRGLEISPRGAMLPLVCVGKFSSEVTLYVALPHRAKMFTARAHAAPRSERGWVIQFHEVAPEDLCLLAKALIEQHGLGAVPGLERKYARFAGLEPRTLLDSR